MEFLRRHYEKLILLLLLVVFILSMVHVLGIIQETRQVTEESLQIPTRSADYEMHDPKSDEFNIAARMEKSGLVWTASTARDPELNKNYFSDLVIPFPMARCPHCSKIIPYYYFDDGKKCPLCAKELAKPKDVIVNGTGSSIREGDSDGDGISDIDEDKYGLDKNNPYDARLDKDGDGFSNIYEINIAKTDPNNPRSRPPLWYRLKMQDFKRVLLPITFRALNVNNSEDKSRWDIQLNVETSRGMRTQLESLGNTIKLDNREYKIVDILKKQTEKPGVSAEGTKEILDESIIYLEQCDGNGNDKISMQVGKEVFSSNPKAELRDTGLPKKVYTVDVGDPIIFVVEKRSTRYRVKMVDPVAKTVLLEDPQKLDGDNTLDSAGTLMLVTQEGQVPKDMEVISLTDL